MNEQIIMDEVNKIIEDIKIDIIDLEEEIFRLTSIDNFKEDN